jgi:hypothetical protein
MHSQNTSTLNQAAADIAGIKSSMSTGRWIFGVLVGIATLLIASTVSDIKDGIKDIRTDLKVVQQDMQDVKTIQFRLDRVERDVKDFHNVWRSHESSK